MSKRLAVIGFGAIGRSIVEHLTVAPTPEIELVAVLMRTAQLSSARQVVPAQSLVTDMVSEMMAARPDIVIEAAGQAAVAEYGPVVLNRGLELFVLSIGALADDDLRQCLVGVARSTGTHISIPPGALAGFDGLLSLQQTGLKSVLYRSIKPVAAWRDTAAEDYCRLGELHESYTFFSGSARDAAIRFPKNANLAVAVAIAGLGLERTQIELAADPRAKANIGELFAHTERAVLHVRTSNLGFEANPKSSEITGVSVIAALVNRSAAIRFQ